MVKKKMVLVNLQVRPVVILLIFHLTDTLEPIFDQLETMKLDKSPFVIISVIGQELLGAAQYASAVIVLEAALRIGTCSLKLRGSVFSALSSAYWALNSLDKVTFTRNVHCRSLPRSFSNSSYPFLVIFTGNRLHAAGFGSC